MHRATSTVPKLLQRSRCSRQDSLFLAMDSMSHKVLLASSNSRYYGNIDLVAVMKSAFIWFNALAVACCLCTGIWTGISFGIWGSAACQSSWIWQPTGSVRQLWQPADCSACSGVWLAAAGFRLQCTPSRSWL